MFQLFLRARSAKYFKARSVGRDGETDRSRAESVFQSIESALDTAKAEHAGLTLRVDEALARSAVTFGNDYEDSSIREPEDSKYLKMLGAEIANGQRRLSELAVTIGHFQFLKTALITRFSQFKLRAEPTQH
jgi:hypothetical protein